MRPTRTYALRPFALSAAILLASLWTALLIAQSPALPQRDAPRAQSNSARIRGRIVAADTGQPLGRAQVVLSASSGQTRTLTDEEGRYEFAGLPAGSFSLGASKTGYVNLQYGQRRPFEPGRPLIVADGRTLERIDMSLPRGAVIVVRVTDELGFPMSNVDVRPQRFAYRSDGQRTLTTVFSAATSTTDDRGEIRLFGLMPGEYVVSAVSRLSSTPSSATGASSEGYAPTFYPGVISAAQATPVSVQIGQESAIQFSLVRSRLARVSGVVVDLQGRPANGARISLGTETPGVYTLSANTGVDGRFAISDVPPGNYVVASTFDAFESVGDPFTVTGVDISDLRVTVGPGTSVSGRVAFEGGVPPGGPSPLRVVLASVRFGPPGTRAQWVTSPDADGRFGVAGVNGRLVADLTSPDGWMLKSVVVGGKDVTDTSFDLGDRETLSNVVITVTSRVTSVAGRVTDIRGQELRDYVVVAVPAEPYELAVTTRRVRAIRAGPDGTFATKGMMPGRYFAVAVEALEEGRHYSPEFQQQVRRVGEEFTLREGETRTLNLRLQPDL